MRLFELAKKKGYRLEKEKEPGTTAPTKESAVNASKTIRVAGQDNPCMTVISRLMKLNKKIMYSIEQFSAQTERIKNPISYMLTTLYQAQEQYHLHIKNQIAHDTAKENPNKKVNETDTKSKIPKNFYTSFQQREYDYEELEKMLLESRQKPEYIETNAMDELKNIGK